MCLFILCGLAIADKALATVAMHAHDLCVAIWGHIYTVYIVLLLRKHIDTSVTKATYAFDASIDTIAVAGLLIGYCEHMVAKEEHISLRYMWHGVACCKYLDYFRF